MRLELGLTYIQGIQFGGRTEIDGSLLLVARDELVGLLAQESLFERVEISLTYPGDSCRIIHVLDVLEPRYKTDGANFPGALDDFAPVGEGRTIALKNVAIVETMPLSEDSRSIVDMRGPGAELSPFGAHHCVVIQAYPKPDADMEAYRLALKRSGLQTAAYLAAAAKDRAPHDTQIYELPPLGRHIAAAHLPRIAYIFPIHSHQHPTQPTEPVFYGSNVQGFMPTVVHPNEILDGALVFSYSALTYFAQNHPVIHELYRRNGRDLWFAGVVATVAPVTHSEKERNAALAARLAREVLGADGIIATKIGGGAVDTDLMMLYARSEELGMKATLIVMERYPDTGITFVPAGVNALVTPGLTRDPITLPAVDRVLGGTTLRLDKSNPDNTSPEVPSIPAEGELRLWIGDIAGAISQVGASRFTTYMG
jgi:glycine reductase